MKDFFTFRTSLAPLLIKIIYWVITAVAVIGGLALIIDAASYRYRFLDQGIPGILILVLAPLAARVWAEFMLAVFEIRRNTSDVRDIVVRDAYEREEHKQGNPQ